MLDKYGNNIEIIKSAQQGNRKAQEIIISDHYSYVFGAIIKMTLNYQSAQDITQDTFYKVLLSLKKFCMNSNIRTWIMKIAINVYRNHFKKGSKYEVLSFDENSLKGIEIHYDDIEKLCEVKNFMLKLSEIPESKRTVLLLKHYYGYTDKEISILIKCPVGTVRSKLYNATQLLRNLCDSPKNKNMEGKNNDNL